MTRFTCERLARLAWLGLLVVATPARAEQKPKRSCSVVGQPSVSVSFSGGPWREGLRDIIVEDLEAGLARHHIGTCRAEDTMTEPPIASIELSTHDANAVVVTVEVRDAITAKRVSRDIALAAVPIDGQSFAVALATDELLWATWAEVALQTTQKGRRFAPPQLVAGVEESLKPHTASSSTRIGLGAAVDHYGGGQTHLGPDLFVDIRLWDRFRSRIGADLRQALETESAHGRIRASAVGMSGAVGAELVRRNVFEFCWMLGLRAAWARQEGIANPAARATSFSGLAVYARSGPQVALVAGGPFRLEFGATAGIPLRAVEVLDAGQRATGMYGIELSAQFAVSTEFR